MEPDYESDFWADHDENCHGTIDSDFCRKQYPDGFVWDCCDKVGTEPGCRFSRHQSDPAKNKRHELDDSASECSHPPEDEDDEEDEEGGEGEEDDGGEQDGRAKKRKAM